jgi:hypothetical protein
MQISVLNSSKQAMRQTVFYLVACALLADNAKEKLRLCSRSVNEIKKSERRLRNVNLIEGTWIR